MDKVIRIGTTSKPTNKKLKRIEILPPHNREDFSLQQLDKVIKEEFPDVDREKIFIGILHREPRSEEDEKAEVAGMVLCILVQALVSVN